MNMMLSVIFGNMRSERCVNAATTRQRIVSHDGTAIVEREIHDACRLLASTDAATASESAKLKIIVRVFAVATKVNHRLLARADSCRSTKSRRLLRIPFLRNLS
jgi:hypothetical protein